MKPTGISLALGVVLIALPLVAGDSAIATVFSGGNPIITDMYTRPDRQGADA